MVVVLGMLAGRVLLDKVILVALLLQLQVEEQAQEEVERELKVFLLLQIHPAAMAVRVLRLLSLGLLLFTQVVGVEFVLQEHPELVV
jgi:hypothetical protein